MLVACTLSLAVQLMRGTLDDDGKNFDPESDLVKLIIGLLKRGLYVAIVTPAGYADQAERYEKRISGLLLGFWRHILDADTMARFFVFGTSCLRHHDRRPGRGPLTAVWGGDRWRVQLPVSLRA